MNLAAMQTPPKHFLGASDAVALATSVPETRVQEIRKYAELSQSTDF